MKKISIITVVRNAPDELDATLTNIESQEHPEELEIIVIDGASTDSTPEVIEKHRHNISYTTSEPDSGLYDAMNKGLRAATGDYVWFINAGDRIHTMPRQITDADIYYGETMMTTQQGKPLGLLRKKLPENLNWKSLRRGMVVCHQAFIVRRAIAPEYDLQYRYVADIDWAIKCLRRATTIVNTHEILSEFAEGGISTRNRKASLRERWKVMLKHYGLIATSAAHIRFTIELLQRKKYR